MIQYSVKTNKEIYHGNLSLDHLHLNLDLNDEMIEKASLIVPVDICDNEKIFMNGFQTWTECKEYSKNDKIRGLHKVPKFLVDQYSFDRYGDYHFVDYPYKKGIIHGFTYCYFRNGDQIRFFGSLNERTGYTMFQYNSNTSTLLIEKDCAGILVKDEYDVFDLVYLEGSEKEVFDQYFDLLQIKPRTNKKLYGYSSWYNRYQDINEECCLKDLEHCTTIFQQGDLFQIDDGWEPFIGDWLQEDTKKFPHGMKYMVDQIHEKGLKAGLWLAPFVAEEKSELFNNHPDWFLKVDGQPWKNGCNWSGFYSLDIQNPEVIDYITKVFDRVIHEWGFDLVKLDFLYGGAPYGTKEITRAGLMFQGIDLLRELCEEKMILGCGVPSCIGWGVFDYCRISCDVSLDWNDVWYMRMFHRERTSTKYAIQNIVSRHQWNQRAYGSDPDVFFLRSENIKLSTKQKEDLALLDAVCGNVFLTSDDPGNYTQEMIDQYKYYRNISENSELFSVYQDNHKVYLLYRMNNEIRKEVLF